MGEAVGARLQSLLVSRYVQLRRKLERIVGSSDGAQDALQETWLRLHSVDGATVVKNPEAYLLRIAVNAAARDHRHAGALLSEQDVEAMFQVPDELADPARITAARSEIEVLEKVLRQLSPRCRAIFMAARLDGMLNREIADHFGVSLSLVEKELSYALRLCQQATERSATQRRQGGRGL